MDIATIVSVLNSSLGWSPMSPHAKIDFTISDIWNISPFLTSQQNIYFVGSRGAGKSTIISKAVQIVDEGNQKSTKKVIHCVINPSSFMSLNTQEYDKFVNQLLFNLFELLESQLKVLKGYPRLARVTSIGVAIRELFEFRKWNHQLQSFGFSDDGKPPEPNVLNIQSKSRKNLSTGLGKLDFSLLNAGKFQIGGLSLTPIQIGFEANKEQSIEYEANTLRTEITKSIANLDKVINLLIRELARHCKRTGVEKIIVLVDDLHLLPLSLQARALFILNRITLQISSRGIPTMIKIFSATDLSADVKNALGFTRKDMDVRNIESSLIGVESKRRAIENLLVRLLQGFLEMPDSDFRKLFPREVLDLVLVLSGGHPRRFLEICATMLEKSEGSRNDNLYRTIMLAAADVVNESRTNLPVQLGIESDPNSENYREWYNRSKDLLITQSINMQSLFFLVPQVTTRNHPEIEQWLGDAVAIGDLLEVVRLDWEGDDAYIMFALNPATIYDKLGKCDLQLSYQDIVNIQIGAELVSKNKASQLTDSFQRKKNA
jgi:hypothetical protein